MTSQPSQPPAPPRSSSVGDRLSNSLASQQIYRMRLAETPQDLETAQRLRYAVFNVEMGEGLSSAAETGMDVDRFDAVCDHLLVEEIATGLLVGTYRLQTGTKALQHHGFYSAQEFDFAPFMDRAPLLVELGRACVHKQHRNLVVLGLLWKGITQYAHRRGGRYLIGCSSLTSQDPAEGLALYESLKDKNLAPPEWRTCPMPGYECRVESTASESPTAPVANAKPIRAPKLMSAYFSVGATICGEPALDREFKTIDFLTLVDILALPPTLLARYELNV